VKTRLALIIAQWSFDHMLGFLYDAANPPPRGQTFDGLSGTETNPDQNGHPISVFKITTATPDAYYMPGSDPGEGYFATNIQLFGSQNTPATAPPPQNSNKGFVIDFAETLATHAANPEWTTNPGTTAVNIMGMLARTLSATAQPSPYKGTEQLRGPERLRADDAHGRRTLRSEPLHTT
jgi:phospholipase C